MPALEDLLLKPAPEGAKGLLGATLSFQGKSGCIIETEAYRGMDDPASHAHKGPTPRSSIMFGVPGVIYVYLIYGMHHCLNIVTEPEGTPAAILIRGLQLEDGTLIQGPGRVCSYLGITRALNGALLNTEKSLSLELSHTSFPYTSTSRIGIEKGLDKLWRFIVDGIEKEKLR